MQFPIQQASPVDGSCNAPRGSLPQYVGSLQADRWQGDLIPVYQQGAGNADALRLRTVAKDFFKLLPEAVALKPVEQLIAAADDGDSYGGQRGENTRYRFACFATN